MYRKRVFVKIEFQLHAITCPGVWLCTHGYLEATVKTLGYFFRTGAMEPRFPLLCHDKFTMEGYFKSVGSMDELESVLAAEQVEITLWQNGRRLAYFIGKLTDLMHTDVPKLTCEHNINVQLLMKATPAFPGIIAPKVELSAKIGVRDGIPRCERSIESDSQYSCVPTDNFILPKLEVNSPRITNRHCTQPINSSTTSCFSYLTEPRRQRPVCHAKNSCDTIKSRNSFVMPCVGTQAFEADTVACQVGERRLSNTSYVSNNSFNFSQITRIASSNCCQSQSVYSVSSVSSPDEHQQHCHICKSYRNVFSSA